MQNPLDTIHAAEHLPHPFCCLQDQPPTGLRSLHDAAARGTRHARSAALFGSGVPRPARMLGPVHFSARASRLNGRGQGPTSAPSTPDMCMATKLSRCKSGCVAGSGGSGLTSRCQPPSLTRRQFRKRTCESVLNFSGHKPQDGGTWRWGALGELQFGAVALRHSSRRAGAAAS